MAAIEYIPVPFTATQCELSGQVTEKNFSICHNNKEEVCTRIMQPKKGCSVPCKQASKQASRQAGKQTNKQVLMFA